MAEKEERFKGRNILSCVPGTVFKGSELKRWIRWHADHENSKQRIAKQMTRFLTIDEEGQYSVVRAKSGADRGTKFMIVRAANKS